MYSWAFLDIWKQKAQRRHLDSSKRTLQLLFQWLTANRYMYVENVSLRIAVLSRWLYNCFTVLWLKPGHVWPIFHQLFKTQQVEKLISLYYMYSQINWCKNSMYRSILLGGHRGHIATFDWRTKKLGCEFHVRETVRDIQWVIISLSSQVHVLINFSSFLHCVILLLNIERYLHNEMMFAVAQKRHVFVYDHTGMELHCLKKHRDVNKLTFLPYHFLLVSAVSSLSLSPYLIQWP